MPHIPRYTFPNQSGAGTSFNLLSVAENNRPKLIRVERAPKYGIKYRIVQPKPTAKHHHQYSERLERPSISPILCDAILIASKKVNCGLWGSCGFC